MNVLRPHSFLLAEGFSVDQFTGRVTVFNVLDFIFAARLPALLPKLCVLSFYGTSSAGTEFDERVRILGPGERVVADSVHRVAVPARGPDGMPNAHRSIHVLWQSVFESPGEYRCLLQQRSPDSAAEWIDVAEQTVAIVPMAHPWLQESASAVDSEPPGKNRATG